MYKFKQKYRIYFRKELAKTICASKSAVPAVPKQKLKTKKLNEKIKAVGKSRPTRARLDVRDRVRAPIKQRPPQWALAFQVSATWQPVIQVGCFYLERGFHSDWPQAGGWGGSICRSPVQLPPAERGFCDSGCYLNRLGLLEFGSLMFLFY